MCCVVFACERRSRGGPFPSAGHEALIVTVLITSLRNLEIVCQDNFVLRSIRFYQGSGIRFYLAHFVFVTDVMDIMRISFFYSLFRCRFYLGEKKRKRGRGSALIRGENGRLKLAFNIFPFLHYYPKE